MEEMLKRSYHELTEGIREQSDELVEINRELQAKTKKFNRAQKLIRLHNNLTLHLSSLTNLEAGLTACLETAMRMAGANKGGMYLLDDKTGALELAVHEGLSPDFVKTVSHYETDSPNARLVMAGKPVYTRCQELEPSLRNAGLQEGMCALAVVPVWHENQVIGCMNIASNVLDKIPLFCRTSLETVAIQTGCAMAQMKTQATLRKNEEHLRSLMENSTDFVVYRLIPDEENPFRLRVLFVSPSITDILGVSDPMKFEKWFEAVHPDDVERIVEANEKAFKTLVFDETARFYHPKKKEWRWIHSISRGSLDKEGRADSVNGLMIDVTEQKKMEEELQRSHDDLERRVEERTAALIEINKRSQAEIAERKELYRALINSEKRLRQMSTHLIRTQEKERKRVAYELHDELGQSLALLKLKIGSIIKKLPQDRPELRSECMGMSDHITQMVENVRKLSRELTPRIIEDLGLSSALRWLVENLAQHMNIDPLFEMDDIDDLLSLEERITVYRIFQEAITNIVKHAKASQIWLSVRKNDMKDHLTFIVKDDGVGSDLDHPPDLISTEKGLGLASMNERARMLGGSFKISSSKGIGTTVTISVPINGPSNR